MLEERLPVMWTSTPCRQYQTALVSAQCTCFHNGVIATKCQCYSTSHAQQYCVQPLMNHLLGSLPTVAASEMVQLPLQPACTCFADGVKFHKSDMVLTCLCSTPREKLLNLDRQITMGHGCHHVSKLSEPNTQPAICNKVVCHPQRCQKVLFGENPNSSKDTGQYQENPAQDRKPVCDCVRRISPQCICPTENSADVIHQNYTRQDDLLCGNKKDEKLSVETEELRSKFATLSSNVSEYIEEDIFGVLNWQQQHLEQLAIQKSEILGRPPETQMFSNCPRLDNPEDLDGYTSKDSTVDCKYTERSDINMGHANTESVDAMTDQITQLRLQLEEERVKVKLYQSLFKQSQEELETLRARLSSKTEKSPACDLDWESYCAVDKMDGAESDDICSPVFKTSQAFEESGLYDVTFNDENCKWPCNKSTDEGVGSEHQSMDQSSRPSRDMLMAMSDNDTLARNNYNIRSLRQALKELSSCYNVLLEKNIMLEDQLSETVQLYKRKSKENRLMKELEKSFETLRVVVHICMAILNGKGIVHQFEPLLSSSTSWKPMGFKLVLRDVSSLRRNIEELNRVALERLVTARYRSSSTS